jgi:hypothetical protein
MGVLTLPLAAVAALEQAAANIARLDLALSGHVLEKAFAYRARLEAVRRQAFADGFVIDPWQVAALRLDFRLCLDAGESIGDRVDLLAAARYALELDSWLTVPALEQKSLLDRASSFVVRISGAYSPLLGAGLAAHAWLKDKGDVVPLRAALAAYWPRRDFGPGLGPLLTGCAALGSASTAAEIFLPVFFSAIGQEAAAGYALFLAIEQDWRAARSAAAARRKDSHAAAAVDLLAATPIISAKALRDSLGLAVNNGTHLLDSLVAEGVIVEVTGRRKRRMFGLPHVALFSANWGIRCENRLRIHGP